MNTDALIDRLASDVKTVPRHAAARQLVLSLAGGALVTLVLVVLVLALRPDLGQAVRGFAFWMKAIYTGALGVAATLAVARLARPEPMRLAALWPVALPVLVVAVIAAVQMAQASPDSWRALWLGSTWKVCPVNVLLLSLPILAVLLAWLRRLAPTRLAAAGALAGIAAGAWAATLYGLHCPEFSALFVVTWYSLGILLGGVVGALLGPRVLRW
ncbi:MAG: DUF1109 domain-containing protein [Croceibacterium sp.]